MQISLIRLLDRTKGEDRGQKVIQQSKKYLTLKQLYLILVLGIRRDGMINKVVKEDCLRRLSKIEGQIRGIKRMIEVPRYCIDIINQITATKRALEQVGLIIMKRHIESCVTEAIKFDKGEEKIEELMRTIYKFIK